jgi:hypothetical protein
MKNCSELFQCFSLPLKEYLDSKGINSVLKAKHCKTDREFWLYIRDDEGKLNKALSEWSVVRKWQ